jgi:hypothetical protein
METKEVFFNNHEPNGNEGDFDKVFYQAHLSKRTRYGQSMNMQFGVG